MPEQKIIAMVCPTTNLLKKAEDYHDESLSVFLNLGQKSYTLIRMVRHIYFVHYT